MSEDNQDKTRTEGTDDDQLKRGMDRLADMAAARGNPSSEEEEEQNRHLGDFELLREIGRGGMGVVYEARQTSLNRRVALKVLPPGLGLTSEAVQRFHREAQAAAKLHHTNIVPVYAIGEADHCHYYAMELVEGQALSEVLKDVSGTGGNPLLDATVTKIAGVDDQPVTDPAVSSPSQGSSAITSLSDTSSGSRKWFDAVAKLVADVADALNYAHGRGVIHRDIKPANLMLSADGRLCITDFGLARVAQEPGMTVSGSLMGTPAYMSPEQVASGRMKLDHRTDVYSLGAVLYELLTHQRPFPGDNREEILGGILTKDPRPPRRFNPRIPVDLETICQKAMEKDPDKRYATAGEFAEDLKRYLGHGLILARRAGIAKRAWKSTRRHPVASTVVAASLVVAALTGASWMAIRSQQTAAQVLQLVAAAERSLDAGLYRDGLAQVDEALDLDPGDAPARILRARLLFQLNRTRDAADEARALLEKSPDDWTAHLVLAAAGTGASGSSALPGIPVEEHIRAVEEGAPDSAEVFYLRATVEDRTAERLELLNRALELDPGHSEALRYRIYVHGDLTKDFEAALADAERLIIAKPRSSQGRRMKARVLSARSDHQQALQELELALKIDPQDPRNYEVRAQVYLQMNRWDDAVADLTHAIEMNPSDPLYYDGRAGAYTSAGEFEKAIADARAALDLNPDYSSPYGRLAYAYLQMGRQDEVRRVLEELRSRSDGWAQDTFRASAHYTIAYYCLELRDYDCALGAADRTVSLKPDWFWGFIVRARIHQMLSDQEAFEADCRAASEIEIDSPDERYNRAWRIGFDCKLWELARDEFSTVVEQAPMWHEAWYGRGSANKILSRNEEALADMNRAIELAPNYASAYQGRANTLASLGRTEEAFSNRARQLELNPQDAWGWANYGAGLFYRDRLEKSLAALERTIQLSPRHGFASAIKGQVLATLGRCDEAVESLHWAEKVDPFSVDVRAVIAEAHGYELYYYCPEEVDLPAALEHANYATAGEKETGNKHAIILLRMGDYAEARRLGNSWIRAMAAWHMGDRDKARELLNKWVAETIPNHPKHPTYLRRLQEAEELFGIRKEP